MPLLAEPLMSRCFDCKNLASLGPRPSTDYLRIQSGQWGMLARGLAYCGHVEVGQTYARFRSIHSDSSCPHFTPEPDPAKRQGRRRVAADQAARFALWMKPFRKRK